ncbi:MAG: hypothetical protein B7Z03_15675, partial [Hydrogenophilales bacterium 32-62-9]
MVSTAKDMINSLTDLILDDATSGAMGSLLGAQDLDDIGVLHAMNVAVLSILAGATAATAVRATVAAPSDA